MLISAGAFQVFSYGALGAFVVALVAYAARRRRLAGVLAGIVSLAGLVVLGIMVARAWSGATSAELSTKATYLSAGISELMNRGSIALVAALVGARLWFVARRKADRA